MKKQCGIYIQQNFIWSQIEWGTFKNTIIKQNAYIKGIELYLYVMFLDKNSAYHVNAFLFKSQEAKIRLVDTWAGFRKIWITNRDRIFS